MYIFYGLVNLKSTLLFLDKNYNLVLYSVTGNYIVPKNNKPKRYYDRPCAICISRFYITYFVEKVTQWLNKNISSENKIGQYMLFSLRFRECQALSLPSQ